MAILVDELREYPGVALPYSRWCHLTTDGDWAELHAFAARLGLRRAWFQGDHYDLPPQGRAAAVALGAEEVGTAELLARMTGPRGDRARRRTLAPAGVRWLAGGGGPAVLCFPPGALIAIGGPPGAGKSTLAARARGLPVLDPDAVRARTGLPWEEALRRWRAELVTTLAAGTGAVAVTTALRHGHRQALAQAAAAARVPAHLVLVDATAAECRAARAARAEERIPHGLFEHLVREWAVYRARLAAAGAGAAPPGFASLTVADRAAAGRIRRISTSSRA